MTTTSPKKEVCQLFFEDVQVGMQIPSISKGPMSTMHIMRWSAAIENWHRIHYDQSFATGHDQLPSILINGSWKQHVLVQHLKDWVGAGGWVWRTKFNFRDKDLPGDTIRAVGTVATCYEKNGLGFVECEIKLENQRGVQSTTGEAIVVLPLRCGKSVPYPYLPEESA